MSLVIDVLPVWTIALLLFVALSLALVAGGRLRDRMQVSTEIAYATSAAVSLLVLLIGFTFSLSLNRYDNRRELVVEEAAAIYSTWERHQLLGQPQRSTMARLLHDYALRRLEYFTFGIDADHALRADIAADALMVQMWTIVRSEVATNDQPLISRMLMDNLTRMDDAAWRREALARAHIPLLVTDLLVIFSLLTAVSMGISGPRDGRIHPVHLIFFALNATAIMLVIDLDQPRSGLILVSQRPIREMLAIINNDEAHWRQTPAAEKRPG